MLTKKLPLIAVAILLAALFVVGLARLFTLRYEAGEVYPAYSTLRADPLGAKAIYAALDEQPGVEVRRNFRPLQKLRAGAPVTLVYLGVSRYGYWTEREIQEFESLVLGGARVVFAFFPLDHPPESAETRRATSLEREKKEREVKEQTQKDPDAKQDEAEKKTDRRTREDGLISFDAFAKRYGFQFAWLPPAKDKAYERHAFLFEPGATLERDLAWHSALYFDQLAPEWHSIYLSENKSVIAERTYGRGSIVLLGDSFPFSNEALRDSRHTALLTRVFSGPPLVVFDEEHHGLTDQPGIVQLALSYRLHGVVVALLLIAALYVWKNAAPFVPPAAERFGGEVVVSRRDAAQGFERLLTRAIHPRDLLAVCADEWRRAFPHEPAAALEQTLADEGARPVRQRDPVSAYRAITRALSRKKTA